MLDLSHFAAISEREAQAVKWLEMPPTPHSLFSSAETRAAAASQGTCPGIRNWCL